MVIYCWHNLDSVRQRSWLWDVRCWCMRAKMRSWLTFTLSVSRIQKPSLPWRHFPRPLHTRCILAHCPSPERYSAPPADSFWRQVRAAHVTSMSVLLFVGPKRTLAASHAKGRRELVKSEKARSSEVRRAKFEARRAEARVRFLYRGQGS